MFPNFRMVANLSQEVLIMLQDCGMLLQAKALRSPPMMILSALFAGLPRQELTPKWWSQDHGIKRSSTGT